VKLSIVIPAYNAELRISRCLEELLKQIDENAEIENAKIRTYN
jgi:glycosyltransferase involved in cell wall biosynthesis